MRRGSRALLVAAVCAIALVAVGQAMAAKSHLRLNYYSATTTQAKYTKLLNKGTDIAATKTLKNGKIRVFAVLTPRQVKAFAHRGIHFKVVRNKFGQTARSAAAAQKSTGYDVWMDYDGPDGYAAFLRKVAAENPQLAKLVVVGHTGQGREILAIKLTQGARGQADGSRPAVLYSAMQHAREWVAGEVDRRLMMWYIDKWRANDTAVKNLLKDTELWFLPVANPDGYQYTFLNPGTRLWRKTLRDNNGNGTIEVGDGVDPNRNFSEHWNYDNEGSSSVQSSDTYRGPNAESEPETLAMEGLLQRIRPKFQVNFHSFGKWLLYPEGWQTGTATADDPIYYALSGNLDNPAIPGFNPGLSSDVLYVTNGETTDYAHLKTNTLAWTPELSDGGSGLGFVFPDNEALVQAEFENTLAFDQSVAKSALDPANPKSALGLTTKPFYLESDDTYKAGLPLTNFKFAVSYGDPQMVRVVAKRSLGDVTLKWQIGTGAIHSAPTTEWNGGKKYGGKTDVYYHTLNGVVSGTSPGDSVKVWFEGGGATSDSFTYSAAVESTNRVLIVAAEDYTGASPVQTPGPHYLGFYQSALAANGITSDVYDVDARGRKAPDALGVLSHYKAVIWYTGDDIVTREPGWGAGNGSRLAMDELLEMRDYLNEGGRVLYTGTNAGLQYTTALGTQRYDPTAANGQCSLPTVTYRCQALYGSTSSDLQSDTLEYWFGAYLTNLNAGADPDTGEPFDIVGVDNPFVNPVISWALNGGDSADNQVRANSFITTSGILPVATYPQFKSWAAARYNRPGGPFDPKTGNSYVYSQIADVSYKRMTKTFTVPAGGGNMTFWTSFNTEPDWDHLFVEIHTAGQNNWTTLPDANGHTTQATGESCKAENSGGWRTLHPWLDHYQTQVGASTCNPVGTSGAWNAASGDSHGWQQWRMNLNAYAGQSVEVSISYASDWATQGLGVFIDDVTLPDGTSTSFETSLDGWTMPGQPAGSAPNANDFIRTNATGFPEGAVVATDDTLYMGFGLEGIRTQAQRNAVMGRSMNYLLRP